jgi:uncharacterized membrane protein YidH (DUF202 family)
MKSNQVLGALLFILGVIIILIATTQYNQLSSEEILGTFAGMLFMVFSGYLIRKK